jgi:hypothetical protein
MKLADVIPFSKEQKLILDRLRTIRPFASSQISHNFEFTIIDRVVASIASDRHLFR